MQSENKDKNNIKSTERKLPSKVVIPEIVKLVNDGYNVTLLLRGRSMRPFLEDGRDKALLTKVDNPKIGDPILAEVRPNFYVLHRIVGIDGDKITLRGDGNIGCEYCKREDFRASIVGFYRKNRTSLDRIDGWKWKTYSWLWMTLSPMRRYLLAFHRRIWLKIFPPKINNKFTNINEYQI